MKKLFIISAIAVSGLGINAADAQIRLGLNVGPARVVYTSNAVAVEQTPFYNSDADDYYYLPDVDAYYDVTDQCYVYFDGTEWVSAAFLPGAYRDYDWRNVRRFEVREPRPYLRADFYRSQYNGRRFAEWGRRDRDDHFEGGYGNRDYDRHFHNDRDGREQHYRDNDARSNAWDRGGFNQREQQYRDNNARSNAWDRGGFNQREQQYRDNNARSNGWDRGGFNQREQQYKRNDQHFDNRGQEGGYQQSNQNNGRGRDIKGGNEHYVQNNQHRGFDTHKMTKF